MNAQGAANIPGDLLDRLEKLGAGVDVSWRHALRVAFDIGLLAVSNRGGFQKSLMPGPDVGSCQMRPGRVAKIPLAQRVRIKKMIERDGTPWRDAIRSALTFGAMGLESVGGFKSYDLQVLRAKERILQEAGARFRTAA
jgi:hypothetical protein